MVDATIPVADSMPAFDRVEVGMDGRIWVRGYRPRSDTTPQRWTGFDRAGRFTCSATMPVAGELLEFGDDYVLMKDPDADGVERVSRFRLGQPVAGRP